MEINKYLETIKNAKYKFIGTEQDLIDNGFYYKYDWLLVRENNNELFSLAISIKKPSDNYFFETNKFYYYKNANLVHQEHVQDLIDKGLVEELK